METLPGLDSLTFKQQIALVRRLLVDVARHNWTDEEAQRELVALGRDELFVTLYHHSRLAMYRAIDDTARASRPGADMREP